MPNKLADLAPCRSLICAGAVEMGSGLGRLGWAGMGKELFARVQDLKGGAISVATDTASFFHSVFGTFIASNDSALHEIRVLDFGCGSGDLVRSLNQLGYSAYGCDVVECGSSADPRLKLIGRFPYRIPFEDESFDFVISTSVLEHAQNKEDVFREMHRVLKKGGVGLHLYPSKWYLPCEPHVKVPFMNFLWPNCPKWYLAACAILGVRNSFQAGKPWHEVVELNYAYAKTGLSYWANRRIATRLNQFSGTVTSLCIPI